MSTSSASPSTTAGRKNLRLNGTAASEIDIAIDPPGSRDGRSSSLFGTGPVLDPEDSSTGAMSAHRIARYDAVMLRGLRWVAFACLVTRPALADPITSRDYAIDFYDGVAIGNTAMGGMGGAGAAHVLGSAGPLLNPAAA